MFSQASPTTAQAQAYEYRLYQTVPPATTSTTFILANVVCGSLINGSTNCTAPVPATINKTPGVKLELTAKDLTSSLESTKSTPPFFFPPLAVAPPAPTSLSVTP